MSVPVPSPHMVPEETPVEGDEEASVSSRESDCQFMGIADMTPSNGHEFWVRKMGSTSPRDWRLWSASFAVAVERQAVDRLITDDMIERLQEKDSRGRRESCRPPKTDCARLSEPPASRVPAMSSWSGLGMTSAAKFMIYKNSWSSWKKNDQSAGPIRCRGGRAVDRRRTCEEAYAGGAT